MLYTFVELGQVSKVKRRSEAQKTPVEIECPQVIAQYNCFMGGVDHLGFFLCPCIPLKAKTRKWTVKVTSHLITFATCNEWIEYIRNANEEGLPKKDVKRYYEIPVGHSMQAHRQRQE